MSEVGREGGRKGGREGGMEIDSLTSCSLPVLNVLYRMNFELSSAGWP